MSTPPVDHVAVFRDVPATPGTYALIFSVGRPLRVVAGALGPCELEPGAYVYIGSAHGAGGLRARIRRHFQAEKSAHWHIDHLVAHVSPGDVIWTQGTVRLECDWTRRLTDALGAWAPIRGFGSSDCRAQCPAHLLALPDATDRARLRAILCR